MKALFWLISLSTVITPCFGTTWVVSSTADSGPNTLRDTVNNAERGDIITFSSQLAGETIALTSGHIAVLRDMTIDGSDAPSLTISGSNRSRIFYQGWEYVGIFPDGSNTPSNVTYRHLRFIDGVAQNTEDTADSYQLEGSGGAIFVLGVGNTVTIDQCTFENNTSHGWGGGAVYLANATTATVTNSVFANNTTYPDNDEFDQDKGERGGTLASVGDGNLTVRNSEFRNNLAVMGGGILGVDCNLLVEGCIFDSNDTVTLTRPYADHPDEAIPDRRVFGFGAAISTDGANRNESEKFQTIRRCTFTNNTALANGGAVFLFGYNGDILTVEDSTFEGNEVEIEDFSVFNSSMGGGMRIGGGGLGSRTGPLDPLRAYVRRSTFHDNTSQNSGGGLWTQITNGGSIEIENVTIHNNRSYFGDYRTRTNNATESVPRGLGGGLSIGLGGGSTALVTNCTVTNNLASWFGGGISLGSGEGQTNTTILNTISAYNEAENGPESWNIAHNYNVSPGTWSNNLQSNELGTNPDFLAEGGGDVVDPRLDPLGDNGGLTRTRALQCGSPAIDAGLNLAISNVSTDQRGTGFDRIINSIVDIGAYEWSPGANVPEALEASTSLGGCWYWSDWFGYVAPVTSEWVFSQTFGFVYVSPTGTSDAVWLYVQSLQGWLWGNSQLDGFYFDRTAQSWIWVQPVEDGSGAWILNMNTQTWSVLQI